MGSHPVVIADVPGAVGWSARRLVCRLFLVSMEKPMADVRIEFVH
jgi:hypothetical protein